MLAPLHPMAIDKDEAWQGACHLRRFSAPCVDSDCVRIAAMPLVFDLLCNASNANGQGCRLQHLQPKDSPATQHYLLRWLLPLDTRRCVEDNLARKHNITQLVSQQAHWRGMATAGANADAHQREVCGAGLCVPSRRLFGRVAQLCLRQCGCCGADLGCGACRVSCTSLTVPANVTKHAQCTRTLWQPLRPHRASECDRPQTPPGPPGNPWPNFM